MEYEAYVARVLGEYRKLVEGDGESCAKKYAVLDGGGKVIHFKGPPGQRSKAQKLC